MVIIGNTTTDRLFRYLQLGKCVRYALTFLGKQQLTNSKVRKPITITFQRGFPQRFILWGKVTSKNLFIFFCHFMLEWRKNVHDHHHHQQDHHQHHDHHYFHVYYVTTISYRQTRKYTMNINVVYLLLNEHCLRVNKSRSHIFKLVSICTNNTSVTICDFQI